MVDFENNHLSNIFIDIYEENCPKGKFTGGFITKLHNKPGILIFSDNLEIRENEVRIKGLHIGIRNGASFSEERISEIHGIHKVDYCVQLDQEIVSEFDAARFSASYPNIIRFLKTTCLFFDSKEKEINHLDFITGEILNRPVAITHNNGVIIGDRLVVDDNQQLIFYDAILIGRDAKKQIKMNYEDFIMIPLTSFRYILLLGEENF